MAASSQTGSSSTMDELKLSGDEVKSFEKAFQDPEFVKIFGEYAQEINDPANKAETEMYLRQLEQQGEIENVYGKGTQLLIPTPEFVIKTVDKSDGLKVFVNMCSSDKVDKPELMASSDSKGSHGQHLSLPLAGSNAQREAQDKNGNKAWVYDITMHPEAFEMLHKHGSMLRAMVESAIDKIEQVHHVRLDRKFSRPKLKFKGSPGHEQKPAVTAIRGKGGSNAATNIKPQPRPPSSIAPLLSQSTQAPNNPNGQSAAPKPTKSSPFAPRFASSAPPRPKKPQDPGYQHASGEVTPSYTLVHQGNRDLTEAWNDPSGRPPKGVPCALLLRVTLPGIVSASRVDLDVTATRVTVAVPGRFLLELPLPYCVTDDGRAKFDRDSSVLTLTLPVSGRRPGIGPSSLDAAMAEHGSEPVDSGRDPGVPEAAAADVGDAGAPGRLIQELPVEPGCAAGNAGACLSGGESPQSCSQPVQDASAADDEHVGADWAVAVPDGAGINHKDINHPDISDKDMEAEGLECARSQPDSGSDPCGKEAGDPHVPECPALEPGLNSTDAVTAGASEAGIFRSVSLVERAPSRHVQPAAAAELGDPTGPVSDPVDAAAAAPAQEAARSLASAGSSNEGAGSAAVAPDSAPEAVPAAAAALQAVQDARSGDVPPDRIDLQALAAAWTVVNASLDSKLASASGVTAACMDSDDGHADPLGEGAGTSNAGSDSTTQGDGDACAVQHAFSPTDVGGGVPGIVSDERTVDDSEGAGCEAGSDASMHEAIAPSWAAGARMEQICRSTAGVEGTCGGLQEQFLQPESGHDAAAVEEAGTSTWGSVPSKCKEQSGAGSLQKLQKGHGGLRVPAVGSKGERASPRQQVRLDMALDLPMLDELD